MDLRDGQTTHLVMLERLVGGSRIGAGTFPAEVQLKCKATRPENILDVQLILRRAVEHLVTRYRCSAEEAQRRIGQEARAKKTSLDEVAKAIIAGETVDYHYDVPV